LGDYLPVLVHISDILPSGYFTGEPLERLIKAVSYQASKVSMTRLSELLQQAFVSGKVLLLLDGLDEAPPDLHTEVVTFLAHLIEQFPGIRLVVAASPNNITGLTTLGLLPVALASWDEPTCQRFIHLWGDLWLRFIEPSQESGTKPVDRYLIDAWLEGSSSLLSPLEITLKTWSAYAGDALGAGPLEAIQAYLNRITADLNGTRTELESLAFHLISTLSLTLPDKVEQPSNDERPSLVDSSQDSEPDSIESIDLSKVDQDIRKALGNKISGLVEAGLLLLRSNNRLAFPQPVISGALAAAGFVNQPDGQTIFNQPDWCGKETLLAALAAKPELSPQFNELVNQKNPPSNFPPGALVASGSAGVLWRTSA
jgi:hypothetical protein